MILVPSILTSQHEEREFRQLTKPPNAHGMTAQPIGLPVTREHHTSSTEHGRTIYLLSSKQGCGWVGQKIRNARSARLVESGRSASILKARRQRVRDTHLLSSSQPAAHKEVSKSFRDSAHAYHRYACAAASSPCLPITINR